MEHAMSDGKSFGEARQEITGDSWLDDLARRSLSAAEAKFEKGTTMDDLYELDSRTWLQLKECALTAIPVLRKLAGEGSADARAALEKIAYILSAVWEGPAS